MYLPKIPEGIFCNHEVPNVGVILHTEFQIGVTFALINSDATIATLNLGNQNSWQHWSNYKFLVSIMYSMKV